MKQFLQKINPAYNPDGRITFSSTFLDAEYERTRREVEDKLDGRALNIITDESADITKHRIVSMSVNVGRLTFFHKAEDVDSRNLTARNYTDWILRQLTVITGGDYNRINSIATDTCSTMFVVWRLLEEELERRFPDIRLLFVPCDSHGLQLLIKDVIEKIPWFHIVSQGVRKIVSFFRGAHL